MRRFIRIVLILLATIVILSNAFPLFPKWKWYYFTTKNGEFYFDLYEAKGRDFAMMDRWWINYKETKQSTDTIIYRTFKINPLKFWEWRQYLFSKKYRYPYINPDEIENGDLKKELIEKDG